MALIMGINEALSYFNKLVLFLSLGPLGRPLPRLGFEGSIPKAAYLPLDIEAGPHCPRTSEWHQRLQALTVS